MLSMLSTTRSRGSRSIRALAAHGQRTKRTFYVRGGHTAKTYLRSKNGRTLRTAASWKALANLVSSVGADKEALSRDPSRDELGQALFADWAPSVHAHATSGVDTEATEEHRRRYEHTLLHWRHLSHAAEQGNDPKFASCLDHISEVHAQLGSHMRQMAERYGVGLSDLPDADDDADEEGGDGAGYEGGDDEWDDSSTLLDDAENASQLTDGSPIRSQYPGASLSTKDVLTDICQSISHLARIFVLSDRHLRGLAVRWDLAWRAGRRTTRT